MLQSIRIKHFITIDSYMAEFHKGLTVVTGESGAGKSVIFNALYCLLGHPFPPRFIRQGAAYAECEAVFTIQPAASPFLAEFTDGDDTLILYRKLTQEGRKTLQVNQKTVTQKTLKEIAKHVAVVVNQHQHIALSQPSYQLSLLDQRSAGLATLQARYHEQYQQYQAAKKALLAHEETMKDTAAKEFLQFQFDDINQHGFEEDEEERLLAFKKEKKDRQQQLQQLQALTESLTTAQTAIAQAMQHLSPLADTATDTHMQALVTAQGGIEDVAYAAASRQQSLESPHAAYQHDSECDARLDLIFTYVTKYKQLNYRQLLAYRESLRHKVAQLDDNASYYEQLKQQVATTESACEELAHQWHACRKKAAQQLETDVSPILKEVGFEQAQFQVSFSRLPTMGPLGYDQVTFCAAINAGMTPKPLQEVASGGEFSRVLLAMYVCFSKTTPGLLFLFDEIDTGVGGLIAHKLAAQLKAMARHHQVLCITHLAQVATVANQHLLITKKTHLNQTWSHPDYVNKGEEKKEIKRMMGGDSMFFSLKEA